MEIKYTCDHHGKKNMYRKYVPRLTSSHYDLHLLKNLDS